MSHPLNAVVWAWLLLEECNNPVLRPEGPPQDFCETEKGREVGVRRGDEGEWGRGRESGWKEVGGGRKRREEGEREEFLTSILSSNTQTNYNFCGALCRNQARTLFTSYVASNI